MARGDDEFAAAAMSNAVALAESIKTLLALHAKSGLEASRRVIKACVDDFAVAGGSDRAKFLFAFQDDDGVAAHSEFSRCRQADHTGSNDDGVDICHGIFRVRIAFRRKAPRRADAAQWVD